MKQGIRRVEFEVIHMQLESTRTAPRRYQYTHDAIDSLMLRPHSQRFIFCTFPQSNRRAKPRRFLVHVGTIIILANIIRSGVFEFL